MVSFDRPFDRHLMSHAIHLVDANGRKVEGTPRIGQNETTWSFIPTEAWPVGEVRITVEDHLEDVAGNNPRELLDRDVATAEAMASPTPTSIQTTTTAQPLEGDPRHV